MQWTSAHVFKELYWKRNYKIQGKIRGKVEKKEAINYYVKNRGNRWNTMERLNVQRNRLNWSNKNYIKFNGKFRTERGIGIVEVVEWTVFMAKCRDLKFIALKRDEWTFVNVKFNHLWKLNINPIRIRTVFTTHSFAIISSRRFPFY